MFFVILPSIINFIKAPFAVPQQFMEAITKEQDASFKANLNSYGDQRTYADWHDKPTLSPSWMPKWIHAKDRELNKIPLCRVKYER